VLVVTENVDRVEADPEKLRELKDMWARIEELKALAAQNTPVRPRRWHKQACAMPPSCLGCGSPRENQLPPEGDWNIWLILSGRGWGKTAVGSQWLAKQAAENPGTEWAIVAPTWRDARKVCIEGRSGLLKALLPASDGYGAEVESINLSDLTVRLSNGSKIYGYSADGYERLRGSNLAGAWVDEAAVMANVGDMFSDALMPALRIGESPRCLITTTPRPIRFLRELIAREDGSVTITRGATWDNADNLSRSALAELRARYEGTRAGRQELQGELLEDVEGALWSHDLVDLTRVLKTPPLARIVVAVDPAVTSGEKSDSTGIVVAGKSTDGHIYILEDLTLKGTPHACMAKAVSAYHRWHADRIIAEKNNGGDYLEGVLRTVDEHVPYSTVTATRGKIRRAEPIAALWEQGRGHIVGSLPDLEDQMCSFTTDSDESPDNLDAAIWAATELNVGGSAMGFLASISTMCTNSTCALPNPKGSPACRRCGTALNAA
jgi:phage terminase large subunit-like protein